MGAGPETRRQTSPLRQPPRRAASGAARPDPGRLRSLAARVRCTSLPGFQQKFPKTVAGNLGTTPVPSRARTENKSPLRRRRPGRDINHISGRKVERRAKVPFLEPHGSVARRSWKEDRPRLSIAKGKASRHRKTTPPREHPLFGVFRSRRTRSRQSLIHIPVPYTRRNSRTCSLNVSSRSSWGSNAASRKMRGSERGLRRVKSSISPTGEVVASCPQQTSVLCGTRGQ